MPKGRGAPKLGKASTHPRTHVPTTRQRGRVPPNAASITASPIRKLIQSAAKTPSTSPMVLTPPGSQDDANEINDTFNLRRVKLKFGSCRTSGTKMFRNAK